MKTMLLDSYKKLFADAQIKTADADKISLLMLLFQQ